jgi:membrane associated rhomboid family serine protease
MDNRRMCPNCRAFITTSDRVCPYCGNQVGPRAIDRRDPGALIGGLIPARHFTTFLLLLINLVLFGASGWISGSINEMNPRALWVLGAKLGPSIFDYHQYWRLVTAGFLHGSIMHIAFNSWALFVLGSQVEDVFGTPRFLVVYFISTIAGFYVSARFNPGISIGASAGIMGLIGAMVAFGHASQTSIGRQIRNQYLGWLALNLVWGFMPGANIDNFAHVGGFAGGFAVAWLAGTPVRSTQAREAAWRIAGAACVFLTAYSFWLMYRNFPSPEELRQLFQSGG